TQVFNISLGASFLNGITHDNNGYLYITDFSGYKIYRFNTADRTFSVYVSNTGTSSPNGIIFDAANNRCIYVNWGSNAPIKAVDLSNGTVSTITSTTLGSCDGIASDLNGNYYVSSWSGGNKITRFSNNFTASTAVVTTGLSNPADIFYNVLTDTLGVPNSGSGNNTAYYYFGNSTGISESNIEAIGVELNFNVDEIVVSLDQFYNATWSLIDLNGRTIRADKVKSSNSFVVPMMSLPTANYTIQIDIGNRVINRSFAWVR
ncbi:MAG: hypothetical protein ACKPB3_05110, partial [Bacteroidota bacterium]